MCQICDGGVTFPFNNPVAAKKSSMTRQTVLSSWSRWWFWGAIAFSLACIVATLIPLEAVRDTPLRYIKLFSTSGENSIGAWWSGMLLLIASLHAFDGYLRSLSDRNAARGWLSFSILMFILSLDEVGSIHERMVIGTVGLGMPVLALLAAVLGGITILSLLRPQRRAAIGIAIGFFVLAIALVQDDLLDDLAIWGAHPRIRSTLEEATEIAAMLLFIRIAMENTVDGVRTAEAARSPLLDAVDYFRVAAVVVALVFAPVAALYSAGLTDLVERGNPSIWLTSASFLLAGAAAFRLAARDARMWEWRHLALGGVCCVMSVAAVAVNPFAFQNRNHLIFSAGCVLLLALWVSIVNKNRERRESYVLLTAICASLLLISWVQNSLLMTYWVEAVIAAIVLYGNASLDKVVIPLASVQGLADPSKVAVRHPSSAM